MFEARADHHYRNLSEADREAVELTDSGEELVGVMRALLGLAPLKTNVNVPNRGQAPDLERGVVVETNALLTEDATTPLTAQPLPDPVRTFVERHVTNQETLMAAGFAGDLDLAFQAFCNDPFVAVDPRTAQELFAELVDAERAYLRSYDLAGAAVLDGAYPGA